MVGSSAGLTVQRSDLAFSHSLGREVPISVGGDRIVFLHPEWRKFTMKHSTAAPAAGLVLAAGLINAQPPQAKLGPDAAMVVQDSNTFALDLYGRLAQQDGNLFFSPYSISNALAMTYAGARGETATQMAKTMHFSLEQKRLHPAFGTLRKAIQGADPERKYELQIANRLWGQKDYRFLPDFLDTTEKNYGAGLKEVDFINGPR